MMHEHPGERAEPVSGRLPSRRVVVPRSGAGAPFGTHATLPPARAHRGSDRFATHLHESIARIGYTPDDDLQVAMTSHLIAPHVDAIADAVHARLMRDEGSVSYFRTSSDPCASAHRDLLREWLRCLVDDAMDADTAAAVARIALEHIRPRDDGARPVPARYMTTVVALLNDAITATLAAHDEGAHHLGPAVRAWSKRCALQLDLLLAAYSSAQGSPHWY